MRLQRFTAAQALLDVAGQFLVDSEVVNCLPLGILDDLARAGSDKSAYLAAVWDEHSVVAVALQGPPGGLVLSRITDGRALDLIVDNIVGRQVRAVAGLVPDAEGFAQRWAARAGRRPARRLTPAVTRPPRSTSRPSPGGPAARPPATARYSWAGPRRSCATPASTTWVHPRRSSSASSGRSREVCGSGATRIRWRWPPPAGSPTGIRLGLVFTPPAVRRRGYGAAVTAAVTQALLDSGRRRCFLFTDLANPTSNSIYQQIGYRPVADHPWIGFAP